MYAHAQTLFDLGSVINESTDCARDGKDPIERLAKLPDVFTQRNASLGQRTMQLDRQSAEGVYVKYREHVRWTMGDVVLMTVDPLSPNLFRFEPLVVARNAPR